MTCKHLRVVLHTRDPPVSTAARAITEDALKMRILFLNRSTCPFVMPMGSACLGMRQQESGHATSTYTCLWISSPCREVTSPIGDCAVLLSAS